jgi:hypothetical protein
LTTAPPQGGDGQLSVSAGDTIAVVYIDADDGQGGMNIPRTATAGTDCRPPSLSNVAVSGVTGDGATISWTTDEPASSIVRFGLAGPPDSERSSPALVTSHSVRLAGLLPCTSYLFAVRSEDRAGNAAVDDDDGSFHGFVTRSHHLTTRTSQDTPRAIPDNDPTGVTSTISASDNVSVTDVDVRVNITHPYVGDLRLHLIAPNGTRILLADQRGDDGDNYRDTVFRRRGVEFDRRGRRAVHRRVPSRKTPRPGRRADRRRRVEARGDRSGTDRLRHARRLDPDARLRRPVRRLGRARGRRSRGGLRRQWRR